MERLLRLVVLIVLTMAAVKYGKPWLDQAMSGGSGSGQRVSGDGPGAECVDAARQARNEFGMTMTSLRPGDSVLDQMSSIDDAIAEARGACRCATTACERANAAIDLLADASRIDDPSQIAQAALDAARRLERVDDLLDQAAAAVGK